MIKKIIGYLGLWLMVTTLLCFGLCTGPNAIPFNFLAIIATVISEILIVVIFAAVVFFIKLITD